MSENLPVLIECNFLPVLIECNFKQTVYKGSQTLLMYNCFQVPSVPDLSRLFDFVHKLRDSTDGTVSYLIKRC